MKSLRPVFDRAQAVLCSRFSIYFIPRPTGRLVRLLLTTVRLLILVLVRVYAELGQGLISRLTVLAVDAFLLIEGLHGVTRLRSELAIGPSSLEALFVQRGLHLPHVAAVQVCAAPGCWFEA